MMIRSVFALAKKKSAVGAPITAVRPPVLASRIASRPVTLKQYKRSLLAATNRWTWGTDHFFVPVSRFRQNMLPLSVTTYAESPMGTGLLLIASPVENRQYSSPLVSCRQYT